MASAPHSKYTGKELLTLKQAVDLIVDCAKADEDLVRQRIGYYLKSAKSRGTYRFTGSARYPVGLYSTPTPLGPRFHLAKLVAWADGQKGWEGCFSGLPVAYDVVLPLRISVVEQRDISLSVRIKTAPPTPLEEAEIKIEQLQLRVLELEREVAELKPDALAKRKHRKESARRPSKNK